MQPEAEGMGEEPHFTPAMAKADPLGTNHFLRTSATLGSTSSLRHYSRVKSAKTTQNLVGLLSPNQLICDTHPFFEGFHPLSMSVKVFHDSFLSSERDIF